MADAHPDRRRAYPFLVGRGRTVPWRVVVAPPQMSSPELLSILRNLAPPGDGPEYQVVREFVPAAGLGDCAMVFRQVVATAAMVGQRGERLFDESSRPIKLLEGVVVPDASKAPPDHVLVAAETFVEEAFRQFWAADDPYRATLPAEPLEYDAAAAASPRASRHLVTVREQEPGRLVARPEPLDTRPTERGRPEPPPGDDRAQRPAARRPEQPPRPEPVVRPSPPTAARRPVRRRRLIVSAAVLGALVIAAVAVALAVMV